MLFDNSDGYRIEIFLLRVVKDNFALVRVESYPQPRFGFRPHLPRIGRELEGHDAGQGTVGHCRAQARRGHPS